MELQGIKTTKCPHCGCTKIKSMSKEDQHINGYWREFLTFTCYYSVIFEPALMKERIRYECHTEVKKQSDEISRILNITDKEIQKSTVLKQETKESLHRTLLLYIRI